MSVEKPDLFKWPPVPLGLKYHRIFTKPQDEWDIDDWKQYSAFLLERGSIISQALDSVTLLLVDKTIKSARGKKTPQIDTSILEKIYKSPAKGFGLKGFIKKKCNRGRKCGGKHDNEITKALAIQQEYRANGKKITDIEAARQVLSGAGLADWKVERDAKTIAKRMSEWRKNPNNSKS